MRTWATCVWRSRKWVERAAWAAAAADVAWSLSSAMKAAVVVLHRQSYLLPVWLLLPVWSRPHENAGARSSTRQPSTGGDSTSTWIATSLGSASYVRWQRGTARIRPPHAAAAERRPCSNRSISHARWAHSSKPTACSSLFSCRFRAVD